jgi:hypothetical protein
MVDLQEIIVYWAVCQFFAYKRNFSFMLREIDRIDWRLNQNQNTSETSRWGQYLI